jgi:hypothetical protein
MDESLLVVGGHFSGLYMPIGHYQIKETGESGRNFNCQQEVPQKIPVIFLMPSHGTVHHDRQAGHQNQEWRSSVYIPCISIPDRTPLHRERHFSGSKRLFFRPLAFGDVNE